MTRNSKADPCFVSVAVGGFTRVKSRSCICSFRKTKKDSTTLHHTVLLCQPPNVGTPPYTQVITAFAYRMLNYRRRLSSNEVPCRR